jgi:hypothetical protein
MIISSFSSMYEWPVGSTGMLQKEARKVTVASVEGGCELWDSPKKFPDEITTSGEGIGSLPIDVWLSALHR